MAARCAPRAMKVTSASALASAAPNPPPTPPAPTTAIRMEFFLIDYGLAPQIARSLHERTRYAGLQQKTRMSPRSSRLFLFCASLPTHAALDTPTPPPPRAHIARSASALSPA